MTDQVGDEVGPQPPRSWWVRRPLLTLFTVLIVLGAAVFVLAGAWWYNAVKLDLPADGPDYSSVLDPRMPRVERSSFIEGAGQQSDGPVPAIPGMMADVVAAGWVKRWETPPKPAPNGYDTKATLPGTNYLTRFGVMNSPVGDGAEVATLFCIVVDDHLVRDQRLIRAVVDSCLAPALSAEEKTTLSTWLTEQDYSERVYETRELARFVSVVLSMEDVFQVTLVSKGRTAGPGAVPTSRTSSTG